MRGYDSSTYGRAFADVYDDWYGAITDVDEMVAFLASLVGDVPPDPADHAGRERAIVELGVGTGRVAIPLAAHGAVADPSFVVCGIDSSAEMLAVLRDRDRDGRVRVVTGDMVADLAPSTFPDTAVGLVVSAYNTLFNLRSAAGQAECFRRVARLLRPGGRFVVEAFVPDVDASGDHVGVRTMSADRVVLSASRQHGDQQSEGHFIELTDAGGVKLRPWAIRWSTVAQLDEMATAAGLVLERRDADYTGSAFDEDAPRHVSVYRRPPI